MSDSDLEDGSSHSGEEEEEFQDDSSGGWKQGLDGAGDAQAPQTITPDNSSSCLSSVKTTEVIKLVIGLPVFLRIFTGLVNSHHSAGDGL